MAKKETNILDEVFGEDHELEAILKQIKKQLRWRHRKIFWRNLIFH